MNFLLQGDEHKVSIEILGRKYPECEDFWDGNWLFANITIEIPGYTADFGAALRTDEIQDFLDQLKKLNEDLKGKASFHNMEDYIQINGEVDWRGRLTWEITTTYPLGIGATLKVEFPSDQSYLPSLIKDIEKILKAFPVIGTP